MPSLQVMRDGIAELPKGPPLVVALMGGTTGIGSYVAQAWATAFANHGSSLRVYVVGRNAQRGEAVMKQGRETSPGSDWRFVKGADISLLKEVDRVCQEIIKQEEEAPFAGGPARLDVLYMSQALSPLQLSDGKLFLICFNLSNANTKCDLVTSEGIDAQMSLLYYSRMRYIQRLTPLLTAASTTAHVISIFAGGPEDSFKIGETPIGTPLPNSYGITSVRKHVAFMKTFFFEELAEKHAGKISFVHIFPGLVDGPVFLSDVNPWYFRFLWRILKSLIGWYMTSPEDCGTVMVYLATKRYPAKGTVTPGNGSTVIGGVSYSSQRELGGGAYSVGQRGDECSGVSYAKIRKSDTSKKVWEHTMRILEGAENKRVAP